MFNTDKNDNVNLKEAQVAELEKENEEYEFTAKSYWPDDIRERLHSGEENIEDIISDLNDEVGFLYNDIILFAEDAEDLGILDKIDFSEMKEAFEDYVSIYSEYDIEMDKYTSEIVNAAYKWVA
jgi:hypothetical protein